MLLCAFPCCAQRVDDRYLEGYAAAIVERQFGLPSSVVSVKRGVVTLNAAGLSESQRDEIKQELEGIAGVVEVIVEGGEAAPKRTERRIERLFDPVIADPRWPHFSASYQSYLDHDELRNVGATSFGESFRFFTNNALYGSRWSPAIQAAVFAIFDLDAESHDLVNADYFVALAADWRKGNLSSLVRLFHQSSHLGDEYLLRNRVDRVNLSYEGVEMMVSYDLGVPWRIYGGGAYIFNTDPSDLEHWSTQYGLEYESPWTFWNDRARPVAAADFQNRQETDWDTDVSLRAGLQFEDDKDPQRKVQMLIEYYNGHSPHGQFYKSAIEYLGLGLHWYF